MAYDLLRYECKGVNLVLPNPVREWLRIEKNRNERYEQNESIICMRSPITTKTTCTTHTNTKNHNNKNTSQVYNFSHQHHIIILYKFIAGASTASDNFNINSLPSVTPRRYHPTLGYFLTVTSHVRNKEANDAMEEGGEQTSDNNLADGEEEEK